MPLDVKVSIKYAGNLSGQLSRFVKDGDWLKPHMYNIRNRAREILVEEDHIRTGSLYRSIRIWKIANGWTVSAGNYQPATRPSEIYAGYVEGGTRYHPAYPYLEPAVREEQPKIHRSAYTSLNNYLSRGRRLRTR